MHTETPNDDLLWRHLKTLPAFRALLRAVEARFYHHLDIPEPVLDLGCGDGNFAQMAFDQPLAAGIDPWWGPLKKSEKAGAYAVLAQSMGDHMPFADHHFASVISNSVLEHIPDVQPVLNEASRVLRPGGILILTTPSHHFTQNLGGARWFGDRYRRFFNRISRHAHTDPPELWAERLALAGFRVTRWQYYFSQGALHALELGHVQGLPSAVLHFLTGQWILAPWPENLRLTERWVRPFYDEEPPAEGAYILIVAQKVADHPVDAPLPPAQPFTQAELQAPPQPQPAPPEPAIPVLPAAVAATPARASAEPAPPAVAPSQSLHRLGRRLTAISLAALTLLLAAIAQSDLRATPPPEVPINGLITFGYALLALLGLFAYVRAGMPALALPRPGSIPRRRWFYAIAFLFVVVAQRLAGTSLTGGASPGLAVLLWLLAGSLAFYAWYDAPASAGAKNAGPAFNRRALLVTSGLFLVALLLRVIGLTSHPFTMNGVEASLGLDAVAIGNGLIRNPFATAWLTNPTLPIYLQRLPISLFGQTVFAVRILPAILGALTVALTYSLGRRIWGEAVALVAAILLTGAHVHLQYSRLGMSNIWDPLMLLLPLGLLALAHRRGQREGWLLAGLASGLSFYFFTSSRLLPIMLLLLFVYLLFFDLASVRRQWQHMLAAAALTLVVIWPQLVYYNANPTIFMERANSLGILQNDWLVTETGRTGLSAQTLLQQQLAQAALAFNSSLDTTTTYNPGIPFFRFWPAVLFGLGLGLALFRLRELRYALLLIWLAVMVLFAGALLVSPPDSHRLVGLLPAGCILAATALVWFVQKLAAAWQKREDDAETRETNPAGGRLQRALLPILVALAVLLAAGDLLFYFGTYRNSYRFGDRNTEIAYGIANYLQSLDEPQTAYLYGPPTIYADFPTIPFLATNFQVNINLFNVLEPGAALSEPLLPDSPLVFLYLPERIDELANIQATYPNGNLLTFEGHLSNPLFFAYEVEP